MNGHWQSSQVMIPIDINKTHLTWINEHLATTWSQFQFHEVIHDFIGSDTIFRISGTELDAILGYW